MTCHRVSNILYKLNFCFSLTNANFACSFWHELSAVQIRLKLQQKSKGGFLSVWKNEIHSKGLRLFGIGLFGSFFLSGNFFGIIRAQSNCGSTCNIWLRWQFVPTNFWFDSHFDQSCKQLSNITLETVKS